VVRQGRGDKQGEVFHPPRTEDPSQGLPDVEAGPRRGRLG
jgi:hypothetical protein